MLRLAVLGSGTMGAGVAQVAACAGHEVLLWNRREASVERGVAVVSRNLQRQVERDKLTRQDAQAALARLRKTCTLEDLKTADVVIEAVAELVEVKRELLERLAEVCDDPTIFATNTSSLSITQLARFSGRPARFIGMHFFNPVPAMKLVEIVRGLETSDDTVEVITELARGLDKEPVAARDLPGFMVNRVLMPMMNEAARALEQGVGDAEAIDRCMKLGCNHPMGPLELADLVGLDVVAAILDSLYEEFGSPHYRTCMEIRKRVQAGWLGRKAGRGFFSYGAA
jgi:3-hydroxybutyryl-CoA dehydrogenase